MKSIEINNVNSIKEEKKMKYKYEYPVAVKVNSFKQADVRLSWLKSDYNEGDNSKLYSAFYRIFHGAAVVDSKKNVLYQKDHGYYKLQFVSAARFRELNQGIVPKEYVEDGAILTKENKDKAIEAVKKWTKTKNSAYSIKFLNEMYTMICGHGVVVVDDEGYGDRDTLCKASEKFTFADKTVLEEFDVTTPKFKIFNGYLDNNTPFIEVTTCIENVDEDYGCNYMVVPAPKTYAERAILENSGSRDVTHGIFAPLRTHDIKHGYYVVQAPKHWGSRGALFAVADAHAKRKGYFTSAISTANYRAYAPKDEGLSYYAIREGGKTKQADYDDYLDHSEMGMFDKGITHELAEAWREFAATLSEENKEFFGIHDNPQGMTEYDPEQEGFAFPYASHETALTDALDDYEEAVKFNKALRSAIVKPNF